MISHDPRPLFAANWKMYKGPQSTREFLREFMQLYKIREDRRVVFFPPSISVEAFALAAEGRPDIGFGVQDVHSEESGAHTGAISAGMAVESGAGWSLAGHSERRIEFGDDDTVVLRKTQRILASGLSPIVCVGETLEERDGGRLAKILARQIGTVLSGLDAVNHDLLTWAYEPVWAIGTGRTASPADASEAHVIVRGAIATHADDLIATNATVLYGGSVKPGNINDLMEVSGVNGVLVGGASLQPVDFAAICSCSSA